MIPHLRSCCSTMCRSSTTDTGPRLPTPDTVPTMERTPRTAAERKQLIDLGLLLNDTIKIVAEEWAKEDYTLDPPKADTSIKESARILPGRRLHEAQRTILAISGSLNELLIEPANRLQEFAGQFWEARALAVAAERRIPDLLHHAGEGGMNAKTLSQKTGVESAKLSRIMRCLCTNHIFRQTGDDCFVNNRITSTLVHNDELRAYVMVFSMDFYSASERFPKYLLGTKGASYDVTETAMQETLGTKKAWWDWAAERVQPDAISNDGVGYSGVADAKNWSHLKPDAEGLITRPELANFSMAMVGGGKISGSALPFDYPWDKLPRDATIVDVGAGVGGFVLQLLSSYPHFKCVVQDRPEVVEQAEKGFWPNKGPEFLSSGQVSLEVHDFFEPNPVKGADVYWLRGILHDWSDEHCIKILQAVKASASDTSRILICDQIMNTTHGSEDMGNAPAPLPANYGYYNRFHHIRDLNLMGTINGIERTPKEVKDIVKKAGLRLTGIYETRNVFGIIEVQK